MNVSCHQIHVYLLHITPIILTDFIIATVSIRPKVVPMFLIRTVRAVQDLVLASPSLGWMTVPCFMHALQAVLRRAAMFIHCV
jgi:hypothetical protein